MRSHFPLDPLTLPDIVAAPEDTQTEVDLDNNAFPSDLDMLDQVKAQYLAELNKLLDGREFHMHNINRVIVEKE